VRIVTRVRDLSCRQRLKHGGTDRFTSSVRFRSVGELVVIFLFPLLLSPIYIFLSCLLNVSSTWQSGARALAERTAEGKEPPPPFCAMVHAAASTKPTAGLVLAAPAHLRGA